jgi:hypothetical protein
MALQLRSLSNSWSQVFYGYNALQITLVAKPQLSTQVTCHILDPRTSCLCGKISQKYVPTNPYRSGWEANTVPIYLLFLMEVYSQGPHPIQPTVPRQTEQEKLLPSPWTVLLPRATLDANFHSGCINTELLNPKRHIAKHLWPNV